MAANLQGAGRSIVFGVGKRVADQIRAAGAVPASRRSLTGSAYDKNLDDQVHPSAVPEDVIKPQSDKYWGPNPATGVFGPAGQNGCSADGANRVRASPVSTGDGGGSVLDQAAWFRPLEDVQKPPPQS